MTETSRIHPLVYALLLIRRTVDRGMAAWHRFWFEPLDPLMLCVMRVLTGWMLFYNLLTWSLELETFFGRNGVQPLDTIKRLYESQYVFSFWLWIDDQYLWPVHILSLIVAAMFCLGMATRVTSILAFLITISYSQRVPAANFGFDQILGMMCLYLALSPCGAAVSVDHLIRIWWRRRSVVVRNSAPEKYASARMASRLIQLHLCAIYFWAGFSKLKGPTWWTGEAMWNVIANQEYQTTDLTWMAWIPWLPFLIAHVTIAWETSFILLIWNRKLRPFVLAIGTAMHLGIGAFLGMWTFGLIMNFAYLSFSEPEIWRQRITWFWTRGNRAAASPPLEREQRSPINVEVTPVKVADAPIESPAPMRSQELTIERQVIPQHISICNTASICSILVLALDPQHRNTLREHFRSHEFDCRAVDSGDRAMQMLARQRYAAVLVHGTGFSNVELLALTHDLLDFGNIPILALLAGQQGTLAEHFYSMPEVECRLLPASLREIRSSLEVLLTRHGNQIT